MCICTMLPLIIYMLWQNLVNTIKYNHSIQCIVLAFKKLGVSPSNFTISLTTFPRHTYRLRINCSDIAEFVFIADLNWPDCLSG